MRISIVCTSDDHPVYPALKAWIEQRNHEHEIEFVSRVKNLAGGDLLLLVSCSEIVTQATRGLYKASLVIHASDLPCGRGWSPHIWQVLEGKSRITVTLLEAEDKVDTGAIWSQVTFDLEGHELYNEINRLLFTAELELMNYAVDNWKQVIPRQQQDEQATYYRKRSPEDSEIDLSQPLIDSFNLLRVADPNRFPAYFYYQGKKYTIKIDKADYS